MTLTEILADKDTSASDKLVGVNEIVTTIRAKYGNSDIEVEVPQVNTCDGIVRLSTLSDDDKLVIVENCIRNIKLVAQESIEQNEAIVMDREVERMIATDNILINITASMNSIYL